MSVASHHADWLHLVPHSGPFLSIGVLTEAFPNGLRARDTEVAGELRAAYETWSDPEGSGYAASETADVHEAFVLFVLETVLGLDEGVLATASEALDLFRVDVPARDVTLMPDAAVMEGDEPLMLISWVERSSRVDEPLKGDEWAASPRDRMVELLRGTECPLGLVTDGERWTLVSVREGEAPGFATWEAGLWLEERITLQAFRTLLGEERFFTVPEEEMLASLLERSAEAQYEVTTKLGTQTLEAVEILVRKIDRLDRERGGQLLANVDEGDLYDSVVTVMMRLIFLFFAEENELLPTGEDLYLERYAASSLRSQLQEKADTSGEEVLETRSDAWSRLLAIWRAVYAGVEHGDMRLAPYGGSLFDPDRYPFLEGRQPDSTWREEPANPLPIDNRTVLHLLNALQTLREGGYWRRLSFRELDVEQIGHVYEGMLDHTATRADGWVLGLTGVGGKEPEVPLAELESRDEDELVNYLKDVTGRNKSTTRRWLKGDQAVEVEKYGLSWAPAFEGDAEAAKRVERFAKFLRSTSQDAPAVFPPDSVYICDSPHRAATGTHYTPRALTEEVVQESLEPLVYAGPSEGAPRTDWSISQPEEILALNVADPACGSGAFLVQACRYLAERLTEARIVHGMIDHDPSKDNVLKARREIAAQCLYGVDKNPMAVEMAKLSLWLVTLAEDMPFSFVDHALGVGDSLFGVSDLDQLRYWNLSGEGEEQNLFTSIIAEKIDKIVTSRQQLEAFAVIDYTDTQLKTQLLNDAQESTAPLINLADLLCAPCLVPSDDDSDEFRSSLLIEVIDHLDQPDWLENRAQTVLTSTAPFHWVLEFPEVFEDGGFDAIVGNPPFLGGRWITSENGREYREFLVEHVADGNRGAADLCAYFFLRAYELLKKDGCLGLFAVNTIAEGDTRQVALEPLVERGASIYSAHPNEPWPNKAAVVTSRVQIFKGEWEGRRYISGQPVPWISAYLTEQKEVSPEVLLRNNGIAYQGSIALGDGFVLDDEEAKALLELDPQYEEVIFPYLNGQDLNSDPHHSPSRWVITFWDWPEAKAKSYEAAYNILKRDVYPERLKKSDRQSYRNIMSMWWRHWNVRSELFHAIGRGHYFDAHPSEWEPDSISLERVLALSRVTKYLAPTFIPNEFIPSNACVIFATDSSAVLALLMSSVHSEWAWKQASTLETRLRYTPTDCFETFPLPEHGELPTDPRLDTLGSEYHGLRSEVMIRDEIGLTDLYNRFHDPDDDSDDLQRLRKLQIVLDRRSLELYGWDDIELDHDFRDVSYLPPNDCHRFAISEDARLGLLDRLGHLNLERFEKEVRAGLHGDEALERLREKKAKTTEASTPVRGEAPASVEQVGSSEKGDSQGKFFAEGGTTGAES